MKVGYTHNEFFEKAIYNFNKKQLSNVNPNFATFYSILLACATIRALKEGMYIHQRIV